MILFQKEWSSLKKLMFLAGSALSEGWRTVTGAIASFVATKVTALPMEFDLLPIQNLNGQANPYPPGGGKNKYPPIELTRTFENPTVATSGDEYTINGSPSEYGQNIASDSFTLPAGTYYFKQFTVSGTGTVNPQLRSADGTITYASVDSPSFTLESETTLVPRITWRAGIITNLKIKLMVASGSTEPTSYAPYSNICPITGHDGFTRTGTGKNLFNGTIINGQVMSDGSFVGSLQRITNAIQSGSYLSDLFLKAGTYTLDIDGLDYCSAMTKDKNGNIIDNFATSWNDLPFTFTTTKDALFIFTGRKNNNPNLTPSDYFPQIVVGGSVGTYESPNIHSYETEFDTPPGTVYGGHVTDNGDGTYDLSVNYYMVKAVSPSTFGTRSATISAPVTASGYTLATNPFYCNRFKPSNYSGADDNHVHFANANLITFRLSEEVGTTRAEWETWFENNPTYVCYKIATPAQYTGLTLTALQSIIGQNHVWVDNADSVTVEYWGH